jgi:amino acid adenylation domain-containing protein
VGVLLSRYTNRTDLMLGVPVSGRDVPELERLIGYFVNLLPLRLKVENGTSFEDLVRDCWARFLECSTWALPFDEILNEARPERSRSYSPIFQFVLNYLRPGGESLRLEGTKTTRMPFHNGYSQFDLTLTAIDKPPHFRLTFEYNTAIFNPRTIGKMGEHLLRILSEATIPASVKHGAIGMLYPEERHAALYGRNATEESIDPDETVLTRFDRQVNRNPATRMLRSGEVEWSCGDLNAFTERVFTALDGKGIRPGDVVAVTAGRSPETIGTILGIWKCGAIWLPLDPRWPAARTQFVIEDSAAKITIDAGWQPSNLSAKKSPADTRVSGDSIAYVLYTSGSTGKPKGVAVRHSSLLNCLLSMRRCPGFAADDTLLSVTPLSFDISLCELLLPLISGARLVFPSLETATNPRLVKRLLEEHEITVLQATPSMWQSLIDEGWRGGPKLRAWCGGETMPPGLAEELLNRAAEVWNLYGPTETTIWSTVHRVSRGESPVPIGRPMANTQCYVLDANLQPVPDGVPGELFTGGAGVSPGYWGHAKEQGDRFQTNPFSTGRLFRTGDMVLWSLTNDLIFLERSDTQVKVRGHRIELSEVETVLSLLPAVRQVALGVHEETLVAWIVLADGALWDPKQLRTELRARLPDYMVPGTFVPLDRLPMNSSGKVDRKRLPLPRNEADGFAEENSARDAAADPIEQALRDLWEESLDFSPVALHDNFFDLGGHSLLAAKLFCRIEKVFGRRLPDSVLFQTPTIAGVASILRAQCERGFSSLVPIQPLGSQPPFFCVPGLEGGVLGLRELGRCLGPDQPVYGIQALGFDGPRPPPCRVEDIAAHYMREICSLQSDGPYYIGGYCFGGLVAFEMARQLVASGRQVGLLAVLDAVPRLRKKQGFMNLAPRLVRSTLKHIRKWRSIPRGKKLSRLYTWIFQANFRRLFVEAIYKASAVADIPVPSVVRGMDMAQWIAARRYMPGPYANLVTLFRREVHENFGDDPSLGWAAIAPNVEILGIPGEHETVIGQPHVSVLADKLKACLLAAQARSGKAGSKEMKQA